jgi:hypothetical protein
MPECCQVLLSSGNTESLQHIEILSDILGSNSGEIKALALAPGQELPRGMKVSTAGVCVANLAIEKLFSGEDRRRTLTGDDCPKRAFWNSEVIF